MKHLLPLFCYPLTVFHKDYFTRTCELTICVNNSFPWHKDFHDEKGAYALVIVFYSYILNEKAYSSHWVH